jgi:cobalt-zinc-cadmium efflux system protein
MHGDHGHSHGHGHSHSHGHGSVRADNKRRVLWVMALTGGFAIVEAGGGFLTGSLALVADAGHMLTDFAALFLAWLGFSIGARSADPQRSYGYHRFQVLAAFINGLMLFAIAGWIFYEAVERFTNPAPVLGGPMLVVAVVGLLVNVVAFWVLHHGDRENINMRGAALHVLSDVLGSVAAIAAAVVIMATGWFPIDPILSVAVAFLVLNGAYRIVRDSTHVLLEGTPAGLDDETVERTLREAVPDIDDIHHIHAWALSDERPLLTLHARIAHDVDGDDVLRRIKEAARDKLGVGHVTVQIEQGACPDDGAASATGSRPESRRSFASS